MSMSTDPNQIHLTAEQRQRIAIVAQSLGKPWEEILDDAISGLSAHQDVLAISASVKDLEDGEIGRTFGEFSDEFRARNGIADD